MTRKKRYLVVRLIAMIYTDQNIFTFEQTFRDISIGSSLCLASCTFQQISFVLSRVDL